MRMMTKALTTSHGTMAWRKTRKKNCGLVRVPRSFFATFTQTLHCAVFLADGAVWVVSYHLMVRLGFEPTSDLPT